MPTRKKPSSPPTVLVGTYRKDQLEKWILPRGLYNYPVREDDSAVREAAPAISELWLYAGRKDKLRFTASFDREVAAAELATLGYPRGKGKPHAERYLLFRVGPLPEDESACGVRGIRGDAEKKPRTESAKSVSHAEGAENAESFGRPRSPSTPRVLLRLRDFSRSPKRIAELRELLARREEPAAPQQNISYFDDLPEDLLEDWLGNLFVCEEGEQLTFWDVSDEGGPARTLAPKNVWDKSVEVEKSSYLWTGDPVFLERSAPLCPGKRNIVELFCGCGGTSCGFEMAGYQTVMGVDILEPAIETFRKNHRTANCYLGDIRKIRECDFAAELPGPVDVLIAGIPCQGFSLNNRKRNDADKRNTLYLELLRILRAVRPKCVVVENVSGIRSSANGEVVREIERGIFEACGLTVRHRLLNAAEFGVPQKRSRVVFVGVRDPRGFDFDSLARTNGPSTGRPFVTVRDAIGDLPRLDSGSSKTCYDQPPQTDYQRRMRGGCTVLRNHVAPSHPAETIAKIAGTRPGFPMYPKFRQRIRLAWDAPSPTQVSGGIRPQFQFGHPRDARGLTIRERCRIQSFPDSYEICGGTVQGRVQTGNAVPPLLAFAIANALKPHLD